MSLFDFEPEAFETAASVVEGLFVALFVALFSLPVETSGCLFGDGLMLGETVLAADDASALDHG